MHPSGGDGDKDEDVERTCDSLLMCIVTVLSHGLRSGGGVGDVLRKPSKEVRAPPHRAAIIRAHTSACSRLAAAMLVVRAGCEPVAHEILL